MMEKPAPEQKVDLPPLSPASDEAEAQQRLAIEREGQGENLAGGEDRHEIMEEPVPPKAVRRKDGQSIPQAWDLLLKWLDCGVDSQGQRYKEIRRRLIDYFARRKCHTPEDLADETFYRVVKYLEKENKDYDEEPARICFKTAKFVFQEYRRSPECMQEPFDPVTHEPFIDPDKIAALEEERAEKEKRLACLEKCEQTLVQAQKLSADNIDLVTRYYYGEGSEKVENHKALAVEYGMSDGALRTKAHRIRNKLKDCVSKCMSE